MAVGSVVLLALAVYVTVLDPQLDVVNPVNVIDDALY